MNFDLVAAHLLSCGWLVLVSKNKTKNFHVAHLAKIYIYLCQHQVMKSIAACLV